METSAGAATEPDVTRLDKVRLVQASFLMLFVELALIRWTGSNVVYLSYFSNFILLGSFLGIGLGFLRAKAKRNMFLAAPWLLGAFVVFIRLAPIKINRSGSDIIYFGEFSRSGLPTWVMLPVIFVLVAAILMAIAHGVARLFIRFEPLQAYALDIGGSVLGVIAFSVMSFLRAPPLAWGIVASLVLLSLLKPKQQLLAIIPVAAMVLSLMAESRDPTASWSPYYKVTVNKIGIGHRIDVNGIPHQAVESTEIRRKLEPLYFIPYQRTQRTKPRDVLIVGAGNGTDVAIALREGARRVDAVEIDPRLYEIGRDLHPDKPYSDPRVNVHITDGRAFLEQTDRQFDLILFALPDSLTLVSGQSSLRLESFLFTTQAMEAARKRLRPGGAFAIYNFYRERWLVDRFAGTITEAFGRRPCLDLVPNAGNLALMTVGLDGDTVRCSTPWTADEAFPPPPSTDDHPFPYLRERSIPSFYILSIGLILALSLAATRVAGGPFRGMSSYLDLFFMGAAFLLLETKSVIQFALLFGTTWFVNALVFIGILLSVLLAVMLARRIQLKRPERLYVLLLASVAVAFVIPTNALLGLSFGLRFPLAVIVSFTPIFIANLVFAERFARVGDSTAAFGANLLGAMVGGLLEYASLVTGYRVLLLLVALLYGAAFLTGRKHLVAPAAT